MTIFRWVIGALWLVFLAFWAVSAIGAKRNVDGTAWWWKHVLLRLAIVALAVSILRIPPLHHALRLAQAHAPTSVFMGAIGALLVGLGVGLAIYARIYLGRNWGTPMSRKQNPELVTGGPYAFVRHPIYSGLILAMCGTAIGESMIEAALLLIVVVAYLIYSARREEEFMCQQFGETYRAYMRRTKMLVPFVL